RIQAEKINARLAAERHIGSYIEFRKARKPRHRRQPAPAYAAHAKWHHADPSLTLEKIERQLSWNQRARVFGRDRPVSKQKIVPGLRHHPRPRGQGPRTVRDRNQGGMHGRSPIRAAESLRRLRLSRRLHGG